MFIIARLRSNNSSCLSVKITSISKQIDVTQLGYFPERKEVTVQMGSDVVM